MICLSKNKSDEYINMFANGINKPIYDYNEDYPKTGDLLIRSIMKKEIMHDCWNTGRNFYYMDSGYFGNYPGPTNPNGWKLYHRIVKNNVQHNEIIDRPDDRWRKLDLKLYPRKQGKHILLVVPSEKPCKFYKLDLESWKHKTIREIKKHTDRPIVIREKTQRKQRVHGHSIFDALNDCHALVTFQSIAAVESVMYGVPAFTTAPTAADPVCDKDLSLLETPTKQNETKIRKWACHLAYGQFHIEELRNGTAYSILNENS